jgi:hypothetical protein
MTVWILNDLFVNSSVCSITITEVIYTLELPPNIMTSIKVILSLITIIASSLLLKIEVSITWSTIAGGVLVILRIVVVIIWISITTQLILMHRYDIFLLHYML